jgi:hypothetical protein
MNTHTLKYFIPFLSLLATLGCKKFVESGEVNINPNASSKATLKTMLPALEEATATNHYNIAYATSLFSQQMAAYQAGPINDDKNIDVRLGTAYLGLYENGMTNAKLLMDLAVEQNAPYYSAMGKILMVLNLSLATDTFGDVPFSDAFKAPAVLYPKYDKQEDLYTAMQKLLDEAIAEAASTTPGTQIPAKDDLIYAGKMSGWIQTAWFLKARLYMHLTKKGPAAVNSALSALSKAYQSAATDFQIVYNSRNLNPWNANVAKRVATGNFLIAPSKRFTDALNGTAYPGLVDPRLPKLMDKRTAASYTGMINGVGSGGTVDLTENTYYGKDVTPLFMATFAEQKFMEAEALFLTNGGTITSTGSTQLAYDAYLAGVGAHMDKVGIDASAKAAYLTNPLVSVTPAGLKMEQIMREKQVALYLQPEAWVDVRRYDYNPALFRGMALPQNQAPAMNGQFIRRSGYPDDELSRNPNAKAAVRPLGEKVWWDQ